MYPHCYASNIRLHTMDVERSSLCNCVVNFLLEENYLLSAFELLHELLDDGRDAQAIRLKEFFSDSTRFPPEQISRLNSLREADPQCLLEEKSSLEEKLALTEYDLRLAQEDILKLKDELQKKSVIMQEASNGPLIDITLRNSSEIQQERNKAHFSGFGPLKDSERWDLNCAVNEYLLLAGYRLTAMTFYEEVTDQKLDVWHDTPACVPDALRHYYHQYLSSTAEAAEEKISILQENESLLKHNERLNHEKNVLLKQRDVMDDEVTALNKSLDTAKRDQKEREFLVQNLKQTLELQKKDLNESRSEITSLKMHIQGSQLMRNSLAVKVDDLHEFPESCHKDPNLLEEVIETSEHGLDSSSVESVNNMGLGPRNERIMMQEGKIEKSLPVLPIAVLGDETPESTDSKYVDQMQDNVNGVLADTPLNYLRDSNVCRMEAHAVQNTGSSIASAPATDRMGFDTIQILSDSLPKIVPYVLINHREELLPLIMCAIERHPDVSTRDSLTYTLFNLIKRPDEQQRQIIMDACVKLAKNIGEMRTETELLPQCWEQINHVHEERRLLVAKSCGQLAEFVRPEIRDSLILSIVQQLIEDVAAVVREAAAHNLALLLPLFPNTDKYSKVEELVFQLLCDSFRAVAETVLKELIPAFIHWGNQLDRILQNLLSRILYSAQRCPPLSGVVGSVESNFRLLGERERCDIDVLLRMLTELLPFIHQKVVEMCPYLIASESNESLLSASVLQTHTRGSMQWPFLDWLHTDCFLNLIQLACLLPPKEDTLRNRISKFLLEVSERFGDHYITYIMLPVFLVAMGDNSNLKLVPHGIRSRMKGLRPMDSIAEKVAIMCVLPLLLAGILGTPTKQESLKMFLENHLLRTTPSTNHLTRHIMEMFNAIRFLCIFEEHHSIIFTILWEMVVHADTNIKINSAYLFKIIVPSVDVKAVSTHVLPALVTLGSDQNLEVKYASIDAFGSVAQNFKNDMIVDKIRVQMDAFLEDGTHEAVVAVVRALVVSVPHTTVKLREYLLSKLFQFTSPPIAADSLTLRRERADTFCEAIRALDATDISASSVRDFLLPSIQNLLKDVDSLDPAHKEALEIILKERSGGTVDAFSKVMGAAHLAFPPSVSSFFADGGASMRKKDGGDPPLAQPSSEDTRFRRIMRGGFTDILKRQSQGS